MFSDQPLIQALCLQIDKQINTYFMYVCVYCIEWDRPDSKETSHILYEGCSAAIEANGEVDVYHQLHGDG